MLLITALLTLLGVTDLAPWELQGLPNDVADRIGEYVVLKGEPWAMLTKLSDESCRLGVLLCRCTSMISRELNTSPTKTRY